MRNLTHSDVIDIARNKDRVSLAKKVGKQFPAIDIDEIEKKLLAEVARLREEQDVVVKQATELTDIRIVKPPVFHEPDVSGLLVPAKRLVEGKVKGYWLIYVQWADGTRECMEAGQYLELPAGEQLWFIPAPNEPATSMDAGWSVDGRKRWLRGYTPDAVNVFKDLTNVFNYYLDFPREEAMGNLATLSLWTILTYVYPVWMAVPYLYIGGPLGSGKSRVFDVLSRIIYRPLVSSNMTAPCLFRTLHAQGGTLLLDEAERLKERCSEAMETGSILLAGYKEGGVAHRLEKKGDSFEMMAFSVFGPKAIAGISGVPPALASRCICIYMFKAGKDSLKPKRGIDKDPSRWIALAEDLHSFALANGKILRELAHDYVPCDGISGRDMEVWQPMFALAKFIQDAGAGGLLDLIREHARYLVGKSQQDNVPERDEILLQTLVRMLDCDTAGVTAGDVLSEAKDADPAMFYRMSAKGVGTILRRYGITSRRTGGKRIFRPQYDLLLEIERSYGIDLGCEGETVAPRKELAPTSGL